MLALTVIYGRDISKNLRRQINGKGFSIDTSPLIYYVAHKMWSYQYIVCFLTVLI
mgnify:CR=1 FL=1